MTNSRVEGLVEFFEISGRDGEEDCQCARCGSSIDFEQCPNCGGEGARDAYEEDPMWYDGLPFNERFERCDMCDGTGGWWRCMSTPEYCKAHPMPGREMIRFAEPSEKEQFSEP